MVDRSESGVFNVNDQWATSLRYEGRVDAGKVAELYVRFRNDGATVAQAKLTRDQVLEFIGEKNLAFIERTANDAAGPGKEGSNESFKGELRGRNLEFRQVILPGYKERNAGNSIALDSTARKSEPPTKAKESISADANGAPVERQVMGPSGDGATFKTARDPDQDDYPGEDFRKLRAGAVPDEVAQRFLHVGDKYYFPDKTLAFIDKGTKLKAETENQEVVRSLIAIAKEREWEGVRVSGTDNFRRQVWREATLQGLSLKGYQPSALERVEVERELAQHRPSNEITRDPYTRRAADPERMDDALSPASRQSRGQRHRSAQEAVQDNVLTGTLVAHGAAKYKFDEKIPILIT